MIDESVVRGWRRQEEKLRESLKVEKWMRRTKSSKSTEKASIRVKPKRFRVTGGGRKVGNEELEEVVYQWVIQRRNERKHVSRKNIQRKAKEIYNGLDPVKPFSASNGWIDNFMRRHNLSQRKKTHQSQRLPSEIIPKIVNFFRHIRKCYATLNILPGQSVAMDETSVFLENISNDTINTTGIILQAYCFQFKTQKYFCLQVRKLYPF